MIQVTIFTLILLSFITNILAFSLFKENNKNLLGEIQDMNISLKNSLNLSNAEEKKKIYENFFNKEDETCLKGFYALYVLINTENVNDLCVDNNIYFEYLNQAKTNATLPCSKNNNAQILLDHYNNWFDLVCSKDNNSYCEYKKYNVNDINRLNELCNKENLTTCEEKELKLINEYNNKVNKTLNYYIEDEDNKDNYFSGTLEKSNENVIEASKKCANCNGKDCNNTSNSSTLIVSTYIHILIITILITLII